MKIKEEIKNTFGAVLALTLLIIVIIFIINGQIQHKQPHPFLIPLKEAISTTGNYFSGISALAAAYIAARLFDGWRVQADHQTQKELIYKIKSENSLLNDYIFDNVEKLTEITVMYKTQTTGFPPKHTEYILEFFRIHNNVLRRLMEIKLEVQNYGFVADKTEFTKNIIDKIKIHENLLEDFFKPIKDNLRTINSSDIFNNVSKYKTFLTTEVAAYIYEEVTYPLLSELPTIK